MTLEQVFRRTIIGTLFTPFVTAKPHGLGIGLVIVQRILDAHGGPSVPTKIPTAGRHSRSRCLAAQRPSSFQNGWVEQIHPRHATCKESVRIRKNLLAPCLAKLPAWVEFGEALANAVNRD